MGEILKIAVLGGDGIGPEVTEQALKVLRATGKRFDFSVEAESALVGAASVKAGLAPLPETTLKLCLESDAILFGAVGDPRFGDLPPDQLPERALLQLRSGLDLYANLRPIKPREALFDASSLKPEALRGVDLLIVRELVSGIYFGKPRGYGHDELGEFAYNTMRYHEREIERLARVAFEAAAKRNKRVTSADKANALEVMQLWRKVVSRLGKERYPDIEVKHVYVDVCAMRLVSQPAHFDVLMAGNLFGDILSDIGAELTGSLGMLPSASIGGKVGLFEPVHGSAPDIAGKGAANPLGAILSAAMLLEYAKGWHDAARAVEAAVDAALKRGVMTTDLVGATRRGGKAASTGEMGDAVAKEVLHSS